METARERVRGYLWAAVAAAACTAAGLAMWPRFDAVNVALMYLLAVVVVALRHSRGPAIAASVLCTLAFNFFFIPPRFTFTVDDPQYLLAFAIILAVGLIVSALTESARRRAQREARLAAEAEDERARSALLASVSHDLRTPLAVLSGASSTLAERGEQMSAEERRNLAESLYRQATNLSEHVAKVLQMTRLESEGIRIDRDWAAIPEIVGSALGRLAGRLKGHRVLPELPGDLPLVRVDAALIEQALVNLLENAAQHTPAGTVVRVRAWSQEAELVLSVEDFGGGLDQADMERVFMKFQHGRSGAGGGVGLGLAICRAIVRLHGGRAWAEAIPGGGTAFRFSLPVEPPPAMPPEAEAA
jgi:two-component system sensor histidine kinase KdpD